MPTHLELLGGGDALLEGAALRGQERVHRERPAVVRGDAHLLLLVVVVVFVEGLDGQSVGGCGLSMD